jgi:hypothetical protein
MCKMRSHLILYLKFYSNIFLQVFVIVLLPDDSLIKAETCCIKWWFIRKIELRKTVLVPLSVILSLDIRCTWSRSHRSRFTTNERTADINWRGLGEGGVARGGLYVSRKKNLFPLQEIQFSIRTWTNRNAFNGLLAATNNTCRPTALQTVTRAWAFRSVDEFFRTISDRTKNDPRCGQDEITIPATSQLC